MLTTEELERVERVCREAIASSNGQGLITSLAGTRWRDGSAYHAAAKLLGLELVAVEKLEAGFLLLPRLGEDNDTPFYALGQKLRAECLEVKA
jgi:hypothetical protein